MLFLAVLSDKMYQLNEAVGIQIKDNAISGWNNWWKAIFPGQTFSIFIVQFVFVGIISGILFRLFKPKDWSSNPEYH